MALEQETLEGLSELFSGLQQSEEGDRQAAVDLINEQLTVDGAGSISLNQDGSLNTSDLSNDVQAQLTEAMPDMFSISESGKIEGVNYIAMIGHGSGVVQEGTGAVSDLAHLRVGSAAGHTVKASKHAAELDKVTGGKVNEWLGDIWTRFKNNRNNADTVDAVADVAEEVTEGASPTNWIRRATNSVLGFLGVSQPVTDVIKEAENVVGAVASGGTDLGADVGLVNGGVNLANDALESATDTGFVTDAGANGELPGLGNNNDVPNVRPTLQTDFP